MLPAYNTPLKDSMEGLKIAVSGKGGAGKTTLAAGLALLLSRKGFSVVAVDCDPDMNLGACLGLADSQNIIPISEMKELIAERTQADLTQPGGYFKLNPQVDDIPARYCCQHNNIRLLVMGKVNKAAGGCLCPENTFIRHLISHLVLSRQEIVILDMVAGSEHLGRGTSQGVDALLIVVQPSLLDVKTGLQIKSLAAGLGIKRVNFIGNKIIDRADTVFLEENLKEKLAGLISFNRNIQERRGKVVLDEKMEQELERIYEEIIYRRNKPE